MADPINLRTFRKQKKRADKEALAEQNRLLHSMPNAKRKAVQEENELHISRLDAHRRSDKSES